MAARDALRKAIDELMAAGGEYHGHARLAADRAHVALDRLEGLVRREEAMEHPAVVEMRHPHLQISLQMLELARAQLDDARRRAPRDLRERADRAIREVDDAMHEVSESLSVAGVTRTIGAARVEPTDHPLRAARDALRRAADELANVTTDEFRGHARIAADRTRIAREDLEELARRER